MGKVYETFAHLWGERTATTVAPLVDVSSSDSEARSDSIRDMRTFVGTMAYRDFKAWLDREIDALSPDPLMGSDVASCYTFKREGMIASRRRLAEMVRIAEEKLSNG